MIRLRARVTLPVSETRTNPPSYPGGPQSESRYYVGDRTAVLVLEIDDLLLLKRLGDKAGRSKGGKARIGNGAVTLRVVERTKAVIEREASMGYGRVVVLERTNLDHDPLGKVDRG